MKITRAMMDRFWSKVQKTTGCWEWTGGMFENGYGSFNATHDKQLRAHRFAFETFNGPITEGVVICHSCDNRKCVHPWHLFSGTQLDNIRDCVSKGRNARGTRVSTAKLTILAARVIRRLYHDHKFAQRRLAAIFGVSKSQIGNITRGKSWA